MNILFTHALTLLTTRPLSISVAYLKSFHLIRRTELRRFAQKLRNEQKLRILSIREPQKENIVQERAQEGVAVCSFSKLMPLSVNPEIP